jgi:uncharacterized membrane protein
MKDLNRWQRISYFYDWGTIIKTVVFLTLLVLVFFFIFNRSYFEMKMAGNDKTGVVSGFIINKLEHTNLRETAKQGNQLYTDAIDFYFTYKVNNIVYYNHQSLGYSVVIGRQLNSIRKGALPCPVTIHYNRNDPHQSVLWFE